MLVLHESVDNVRAILQDLIVHIALATRETSPISKNHHWQLLAIVEVLESLGGLECGVGIPNTTCLLSDLLHRIWISGIGRSDVLYRACLNSDDTHWDATEAGTADNYSSSPTTKCLLERVLVKETG